MIWTVDTATNVCPSIHVFNSIAINTVIQHSNAFKHKKLVHVGSYILALAICMSTVFLKLWMYSGHAYLDWFCIRCHTSQLLMIQEKANTMLKLHKQIEWNVSISLQMGDVAHSFYCSS